VPSREPGRSTGIRALAQPASGLSRCHRQRTRLAYMGEASQLSFVVLSTTDWEAPQFGSRQQIALRLARRGHSVLFVEVPRALHSLVSDPLGTWRAARRFGSTRMIEDRLLVYTPPPVLPVYYSRATNGINQRLLLCYLRGAVKRCDMAPDVVWTYWPNTAHLVSHLASRVSVYHCIDDFAAAGYPLVSRRTIATMEADQCREVDIVFARTGQLARAKRVVNPNTHLLPGGVDTTVFDPETAGPPPEYIASLPKPVVGFVGTVDDRVDVDLLVDCAAALPEATFALVGPVRRHRVRIGRLASLPNLHLFPPCPHDDVPAVVAGFDVSLIPYVVDEYTRALSPIKLYEYLAMGKPVVATRSPYVEREADNVRIASNTGEFTRAVSEAILHPPTAGRRASWRAAAAKHSWSAQVDEIESHLSAFLAGKPSRGGRSGSGQDCREACC
jgi:glycosyltransferase involved in cell wall biosynthesis